MDSNLRTVFCEDEFWNYNLTWKTDTPKLTKCLGQVGLNLIPNLVLYLLLLFEIRFAIKSKNKRISFNKYNVTRILICLFAFISNLILLCNYGYSIILSDQNQFTLSDLFAALSKLAISLLLIIVFHYQRIHGIITSGIVFSTTFLLTITSGLLFLDTIYYNESMYTQFEIQNIYSIFSCVFSLFFLSWFIDDPVEAGLKPDITKECLIDEMETEYEINNDKVPEVSAKMYCSFISKITYFWHTKLVKEAAKKDMNMDDIWEVEEDLKVDVVSAKFNEQYYKELVNIENSNRNSIKKNKFNAWNGFKVIWRTYYSDLLIVLINKLMYSILTIVAPILLKEMIRFVSDSGPNKWHGILIIFGFVINSFLQNVFFQYYLNVSVNITIKLRTCLTKLIFSKYFKISPQSKKNRSTGEIVNLMSNDASSFSFMECIFVIFLGPLQIFIVVYLLYQELGKAVFFGVSVILILVVLNAILLRFTNKLYAQEMKIKDNRIKLINEILSGIRIIKMYSWEKAFLERVTNERNKEVKKNRNIQFIDAFDFFLNFLTPSLVFAVTISIYLLTEIGNELTPEKVFFSIALLGSLQDPFSDISQMLTTLTKLRISLRRICSFLAEDEMECYIIREFDSKMALVIKDNSKFVWETEIDQIDPESTANRSAESNTVKKKFALKNINLEVKKGEFTVIIGKVGSGKSSLISSILGEMHLVQNSSGMKGKVNISGDQNICYVAQQAFIQNNSFKENILFGKLFNQDQYSNVIGACALESDLKQFEGGDETEIGEKGINLSGGQKQRVSIARACYTSLSNGNINQIVILDDPLSAVDAHVGKHLCENVLNSKTGILKDTTRILATNQLNQLKDLNVDQIVLLKDGEIKLKCTYEELMEMEKAGLLNDYDLRLSQNDQSEEDKSLNETNETSLAEVNKKSKSKTGLIEKETLENGRVNFLDYIVYLKYFGYAYAIFALAFLIMDNFFSVYSQNYLAEWTETKLNTNDTELIKEFNRNHLLNYIYICAFRCLLSFGGLLIIVLGAVRTFKLFHKNLLFKILRSPMSFFDTTPLGRIVNRFSKDIKAIDSTLPWSLKVFLTALLNLFASIGLLIFKQPNLFLFYLFIFVIYYFLMDLYIISNRLLRRLNSNTSSPIFSHFSESINGCSTIRAYKRVEEFERYSRNKIGINNRADYYSFQGNRWLAMNSSLLATMILLVVTSQFIFSKKPQNPGEVGLLISYTLNITNCLIYTIKFYSYFEANAVSIERINEYCNNEEEDDWIKEERPSEDWPENGEIEFENYSTRYRENTNLILKDLNFKVDSTEKIGVVGRTGAGKSTITLSLFRIMEPVKGRILIDNLDISKIGLHDLRSKLSIIPQDPVLFTGSIRFNLDPFDKYSDKEIFESLEHAHLKEYVNSLEDGIQHKIAEGGENLSVGQRQLICLARALLRKSKILVLDEATASVDFATDELVQKTIRSEFKDCTIVTIAHRLNTVIDSSRILVLDKGELKEYEKPDELLKDKDSIFYSLASKANLI